jgi:adenylate kinase family enzyme/nucleoside diphosphate kinase
MLALDEKVRTVVLLKSELYDSQGEKILSTFQAQYLDVKAHKQVFLTSADSDNFFHYLPKAERMMGLVQVMVLENLDGDVVECAASIVESIRADIPQGSLYCSPGSWDAARDLEYFFPHLSALPVERTLALIKPDGLARGQMDGMTLEEATEAQVAEAGLVIVGKKRIKLDAGMAKELCKSLEGQPDHQGAIGVLLKDPGCLAMCLEGAGAVGKWNLLCGPNNCGVARERAPNSLRAKWGTDSTSNAVHASASLEVAETELQTIFPEGTLQLQRTLCIVKPDAMPSLLMIRQAIEEKGFTILAEKQTVLEESRAREFYRDLEDKPFFNALVKHACSGPCCILVLCRLEAVAVWQQLIGPEVVKDARRTRPNSLRARFGRDGQRNAVHGSDSAKSAAREVRFFFPEMGADPVPDDEAVRDYLFRKSALASMDLKTLEDTDPLNNVDPTLQQLLSKGLLALCQVQPKGLGAVKWLSRWLAENNPNTGKSDDGYAFIPDGRPMAQVIEHGVNQDGLPFSVEAPPAPPRKQVIDVDVSKEQEGQRTADLSTPPFVVFLSGGPGVGKNTQCAKLREEFNLVHLSTAELMQQEIAAKTYLGTEIFKHMQSGSAVPDSVMLQLIKKTMVKHQDTNRFLLDGFPKSVQQAKRFEQEIAEIAFGLHFQGSSDLMRKRVTERAGKDDNAETVEKNIKLYEEQTLPLIEYYTPIGKVRTVQCERAGEEEGSKIEKSLEEVYSECKRFFSCRFLYLLGPPGAPVSDIADRLESKYGYSAIDFNALLATVVKAGGKDAATVEAALKKGKPIDASIACPLVLSEIYRDMALGVQNFVICDFPQTKQQSDFLEYRIPNISKTLLLDFLRADAEDLQTYAPSGGDAVEIEVKNNTLFGDEMKQTFASLGQRLVRVPCSLVGLESYDQLVEATWSSVQDKVMPSVTIVLGLPGSGTEMLAKQLAQLTPNTYVVDCDQLLDKELERRTELGLTMHNMLARGQVVPLSMTLELLKNVVSLTSSDNLVLLNCPMYVDQIEYINKEFRIDRVFYINGDAKAVGGWRDSFCKKDGEDTATLTKVFNDHIERLEPIVVHFSRLGKLEQFDVVDTPKPKMLQHMVEQATMPQFAIMNGVSPKITGTQADLLAAAYGVGPALTTSFVAKWAEDKLKRKVDITNPAQVFSALQQYADSNGFPLLVLNRYPSNEKDAAAFQKYFGDPKVVACFNMDEEAHMESFKEENPDDDTDADELASKLEAERKQFEKTTEEFKAKCSPSVFSVNMADLTAANVTSEALHLQIRNRCLPKVYVLVAPSGQIDFSSIIANTICTSRREGKRAAKITVIDSNSLFKPGGHSKAIEDKLGKAAFTAESPDAVPAPLWKELLVEALQTSANPMGTFLVTNFPTPCCMTSTPSIRDQFSMLESISSFMGVLHVSVADNVYTRCVGDGDYAQYAKFDSQVKDTTLVQFGANRIKECTIDQIDSIAEAANAVAADFMAFQEKAEQRR